MAFVVEGFGDRKRKADPRYVKYIARMWNEIDGKETFKNIPMHECTDSDLAQFYDVDDYYKKKYDAI